MIGALKKKRMMKREANLVGGGPGKSLWRRGIFKGYVKNEWGEKWAHYQAKEMGGTKALSWKWVEKAAGSWRW